VKAKMRVTSLQKKEEEAGISSNSQLFAGEGIIFMLFNLAHGSAKYIFYYYNARKQRL